MILWILEQMRSLRISFFQGGHTMEKTMLDYIKETPDVLNGIIDHSYEYTKDLVTFYHDKHCEGIILIASGSSYNGCLMAKPFLKHILGIEVSLYCWSDSAHTDAP